MRLLLLTNYFPPNARGGYELWCHDMASEWAARGHEVTILTSRPDGKNSATADEPFTVRQELELEVCGGLGSTLRRVSSRKARIVRSASMVRRVISEARPDVAVVWGMWNVPRVVPTTLEQLMPTRTVYYLADYWPLLESAYAQQLGNPAKRRFASRAKRILAGPILHMLRRDQPNPKLGCRQAVCCSAYLRDRLVESGVLPPSASVIYGGVDHAAFSGNGNLGKEREGKPLRLLFCGRVVPEKGVHVAVEALAVLNSRADSPSLELGILGQGPDEYVASLRRLVAKHGLERRVHFLDGKPIKEVPDTIRQFDICVFTSVWPEPFGRTIVEAMSAGLVVIGSEVGGSREILDRYDKTVVFPPGDAEELATRIAHVARRPELRMSLRRKGLELAANDFSKRSMADQLERYLARVAAAA